MTPRRPPKQARADIAYSSATLASARVNLGYTRITAPISGRIGRSNVTVGALATAHQGPAFATIQQLDPIYVDVAAVERQPAADSDATWPPAGSRAAPGPEPR